MSSQTHSKILLAMGVLGLLGTIGVQVMSVGSLKGRIVDTAYAQPYNAIIRNWTTADGVAGIMDFASDTRLGATDAANNATYFSDQIHPTDAGYTIMQGIAAPVISNLIAGL